MGNLFTSVKTNTGQQTESTSTCDKPYESLDVQTSKQVKTIADTNTRSDLGTSISTVTVNEKTTVVSTSNQTLADTNSKEDQGTSNTSSTISIEEIESTEEDEPKGRVKRNIISVPSYANRPGGYRLDANGRWRQVL